MKEHILFLNMFALYQPQELLGQLLLETELVSADIDQSTRRITANVHSCHYIPQRLLVQAENEISQIYRLNKMEIVPTFPAEEISKIEPEELTGLFVTNNPMARASLAGATWTWN